MYNSEHGQDQWLNEHVFRNSAGGVFVEFGALDGVTHSNSFFFESQLGWRGLCIEANPCSFGRLTHNRKCSVDNRAVYSHPGLVNFTQFDGGLYGWSGIEEAIEPEHWDRIKKNIPSENQKVVQVPCDTLDKILRDHSITEIDYLSADAEGAEEAIFKVFPFDKYPVHIIDCENNWDNESLRSIFREAGYTMISRLGPNDIWEKKT